MYVCEPCVSNAGGVQTRALGPLEMGSYRQFLVTMQALGIQPGSSGRVVGALNH